MSLPVDEVYALRYAQREVGARSTSCMPIRTTRRCQWTTSSGSSAIASASWSSIPGSATRSPSVAGVNFCARRARGGFLMKRHPAAAPGLEGIAVRLDAEPVY